MKMMFALGLWSSQIDLLRTGCNPANRTGRWSAVPGKLRKGIEKRMGKNLRWRLRVRGGRRERERERECVCVCE